MKHPSSLTFVRLALSLALVALSPTPLPAADLLVQQPLKDFSRVVIADDANAVQRAAEEELANYAGQIVGHKMEVLALGKLVTDAPGLTFAAAEYFGTKGFFHDYHARLDERLKESTSRVWAQGLAALREGALKPMELAKQVQQAESDDAPRSKRTRGQELAAMWQSLASAKP